MNNDDTHNETLEQDESTTSRREFLKRAGLVAAGLALSGAVLAQDDDENQGAMNQALNKGLVDLGPVTAFKPNSMTDHTRNAGAFISRTADGLIALSPVCTHQGCTTRYQASSNEFACPCHGAGFAADGNVTRRPGRAPLAAYPLQVKNGHLFVNTNKLIQRSSVQKTDFLKI
jgi:cytochrome b6-f complex iron-sulfur subunit